ncbi:hypothetical protein ABPG75_006588 [Micractinium tetrahymenae]
MAVANWSNPPPYVMELLGHRLCMQDRVACLAVCKGWRSLESELFSTVAPPSEYRETWGDGKRQSWQEDRASAPTIPRGTAGWQMLPRGGGGQPASAGWTWTWSCAWLRDPGSEGWDACICSAQASAALEAVLDATLPRHAGSLQVLTLGAGSCHLHSPSHDDLERIAGVLARHAPALVRLQRLGLGAGFAEEVAAPAVGAFQSLTRLEFKAAVDASFQPNLDHVKGLRFPETLRSAHINFVERFPRALGACPALVDLEIQLRFPPPAAKKVASLQAFMLAVGGDPERVRNIPEEQLEGLGLIEPRELRPLAQLTQLTALCMSGDLRRCPPAFSALGRLQDLNLSATRKIDNDEGAFRTLACLSSLTKLDLWPYNKGLKPAAAASLCSALTALSQLRSLDLYLCHGVVLQPGPWQRQLTHLHVAWQQLAPTEEAAGRACQHLASLQELEVHGWGQKRGLPSVPAIALLGVLSTDCRALRKLRYGGNSIRWAAGEQQAALAALQAALPGLLLPRPTYGAVGLEEEEGEAGSASEEDEEEGSFDEEGAGSDSDGPEGCCVM